MHLHGGTWFMTLNDLLRQQVKEERKEKKITSSTGFKPTTSRLRGKGFTTAGLQLRPLFLIDWITRVLSHLLWPTQEQNGPRKFRPGNTQPHPDLKVSHLDDVQQHPVHDEPEQDVDEKERDRVPAEQEVDGPGCQDAEQHALGQRLQQDGVRTHGRAKLDPPEIESRGGFKRRTLSLGQD